MSTALATVESPPEWVAERARFEACIRQRDEHIARLEQRIAWFERQIFGEKSERRLIEPPPEQMALGEGLGQAAPAVEPTQPVAAHQRRRPAKTEGEEPALFFDPERVPVQTIDVPNPEIDDLTPEAYEVIGEKLTHRLAQRPGSYVMLKYVRQVVKVHETAALSCPPAPAGVIEGGRADVSFVAGLVIDKFLYHLPLYRQHQRLLAAGIDVSRQWLTQQILAVALLLAPIVAAQLDAIRACRVKAMDETPIKAGRKGPGQLKTGVLLADLGRHRRRGRRRDRLSLPTLACRHPGAPITEAGSGTVRGETRCCSPTAMAPMPSTPRAPASPMPNAGHTPDAPSSGPRTSSRRPAPRPWNVSAPSTASRLRSARRV